MLYQFFPVPGAACPAGAPFIWECDACEAKVASKTTLLPKDWTDFQSEDDGGAFRIAFCPDCSASEARGQFQ